MHESVRDSLEDYLRPGSSVPGVEEHLRACESCRQEVEAIRKQNRLLQDLKAPAEIEPSPGFYARVINRIETQTRPSVWSLFGDSLFARRLVYASATFLLLLGGLLITSTQEAGATSDAELILAGEQLPAPVLVEQADPQRNREVILVNLATYSGSGSVDSGVYYPAGYQ
jgi:predicted anti-sigma-YlaC factor YlaD